MAIHFPENFKKTLADGFRRSLVTESMMSHDLDQQFSGVKTVHEMIIQPEPLEDYSRTQSPATGSRYGTVKEVQDRVVTYTMAEDKSFTLSIDKGNNKEQLDLKKVGAVMKVQRDEVINPYLDKYRLAKWAKEAGLHWDLGAALTKTNIVTKIIEMHNEMLERKVPESGLTLVIARKYLPTLKLSAEWIALDALGGKTLPSGSIGEFDGMAVKTVPTSLMPDKVAFMIVYKGSILAPMKIHEMKGHVDPPGLNGDLIEFRLIHDAFVRAAKADGVAVAVETGNVVAKPTFSLSGNNLTISTTTSGATIYYTTDGSDPRFSLEKKTYTAAVVTAAGDQVRAYADKDGLYGSEVAEYNR